jgi:hypothetical protein
MFIESMPRFVVRPAFVGGSFHVRPLVASRFGDAKNATKVTGGHQATAAHPKNGHPGHQLSRGLDICAGGGLGDADKFGGGRK